MAVYTVFGQPDLSTLPLATDASDYTMGMQFVLSANAALTGVWWYAHTGGTQMPIGTAIMRVSDHVILASHMPGSSPPVWSGAVGSGQWVKDPYDGSVTLLAGVAYKVVILGGGGSGNWYTFYTNYWDGVGPGASGVTNGIITAPNNAGADGGQDTYNPAPGGLMLYPATSFNSSNYWMDVEVSTGGGGGGLTAAGILLGAGIP